MSANNFWSRHRAAKESGLNDEWALKVAYGCIELDDALGAMDHQSESESIMSSGDKFRHFYSAEFVVSHCKCTIEATCQLCLDEIPF